MNSLSMLKRIDVEVLPQHLVGVIIRPGALWIACGQTSMERISKCKRMKP
ncbi:hypothetical protein [Shewanella gelidii]|nr:hypothetical protein [Shewanella gelidii]MCL1099215.1 hypothetical protein [Shewanella gelidii]